MLHATMLHEMLHPFDWGSEWKKPIVCCQLSFRLLKISDIIEIKKKNSRIILSHK